MILKRFTYSNFEIIAPCKCGTRWLERKTNPIEIRSYTHLENFENLTNKTYWVYRDGVKHLISALKTEIRGSIDGAIGESVDDIIKNFLRGGYTSTHWSSDMFKYMFINWRKFKFLPLKLENLSNLFPNIEYDANEFNLREYTKSPNDDEFIIKMVSEENMKILYKMISEDEIYLYKIINNEFNLI